MLKCTNCPFCEKETYNDGYNIGWSCRFDDHDLGGYKTEFEKNPNSIYYKKEDNLYRIKCYNDTINQECSLSIEDLKEVINMFNKILEEKTK